MNSLQFVLTTVCFAVLLATLASNHVKAQQQDNHRRGVVTLNGDINVPPLSPPSSSAPFDSFRCEYFDGYPSVCGNLTQCQYCCSSGQCLETAESAGADAAGGEGRSLAPVPGHHVYPGNFTCPNAAVLSPGAMNCDSTCEIHTNNNNGGADAGDSASAICAQCLDRSWCLHCNTATMPSESCLHRDSAVCPKTMADSCVPSTIPDDKTFVDDVIPWVVLFCIIAGVLVILIPLCRWCWTSIKRGLEVRRDARRRIEFREQQQRREQAEQDRREGRSSDAGETASTSDRAPSSVSRLTVGGASSSDGYSTTATAGRSEQQPRASAATVAPQSITDSSTELAEHEPLLSSASAVNDDSAAREGEDRVTSVTPERNNGHQRDETSPRSTKPAASASTKAATSVTMPPAAISKASFSDEDACQLCLDARATIVYYPCYHSYCCEDCSAKIRPTGNRRDGHCIVCPFCRQRVRAMVNTEPLPDTIKQSLRKKRQ